MNRRPDPTPHEKSDSWTLRVLFSGREIEETRGCRLGVELVIGRAPGEGGLQLEDGRTSRTHAVFRPVGDQLSVHDLGSQNGTAVNGVPITSAKLADGDVIRVGDTLLCVRWGRSGRTALPGIHGYSPAVNLFRKRLVAAAHGDGPVLLHGESGVGKRIAARAIHRADAVRSGPFLLRDAAAVGDLGDLDGGRDGTVFIREVGALTPVGQALVLRVLHDRVPNMRIIGSAGGDLAAAVQAGTFSAPLLELLHAGLVQVPPLRDRREDVLQLLKPHLGDACGRLSADLAEELTLYDWPGNVRQIQRVAEELAIRGRGLAVLGPELFDSRLAAFRSEPEITPLHIPEAEPRSPSRDEVVVLLRRHRGLVARVAAELGQSVDATHGWLRTYDLDPQAFRVDS